MGLSLDTINCSISMDIGLTLSFQDIGEILLDPCIKKPGHKCKV